MSSDISIELKNLGKAYQIYRRPQDRLKQMIWRRGRYYQEYWALNDVSLTIKRGETVGIIGRNGSGKSTLLQMIAGTLDPTTGTKVVNGRVAALLELGAGFNPEFTGRENLHLAAAILGLTQAEIAERFQAIVEFAAIGDFLDQPVKLYSSGMYARLAFAVAAHVDADILIVDEILAVGDVAFTQKCMRFIRQFKEKGTLLLVSHDAAAIINLCDRAAWIDRGSLREVGVPKEVCHNYIVAMEQERDDSSSFQIGGNRRREIPAPVDRPVRDVRADLLESSVHRNEIELFEFNPDAPWFGQRGAEILDVRLETPDGQRLALLTGGEEVIFVIDCHTEVDLSSALVGFQVKDRLGQVLFGDNTYLTYRLAPAKIAAGTSFRTSFHFQMPYLATGDYAILVAVCDGTQTDLVKHQWIDEAVVFKVHSSHVRGLVGVAMLDIKIAAEPEIDSHASAQESVESA
jgi:lipopolysaccharide transport system ATP-binding protein